MVTSFHFAYPWHIGCALLFLGFMLFVRHYWYQPLTYLYPLTSVFKKHKKHASTFYSRFFYIMRFMALLIMALLIGKPQFVDTKSKVNVEGVDIMLALDMSNSMLYFDDLKDRRTRWKIAKQEALKFIDKRDSDAIGLVIFGRYAIARCPLTSDKNVLKDIVSELEIGMPSQDMGKGTMLSQSILTASRRLQKSKAKSKVLVLLTDGEPSDLELLKDAVDVAKKFDVKIYTIGVGGEQAFIDQGYGPQVVMAPLNVKLLQEIARVTGGAFFAAKKPEDLADVYNTIDKLEKVSYETELFSRYHDYFIPLLWWVIILLLFELSMATFVWFIV